MLIAIFVSVLAACNNTQQLYNVNVKPVTNQITLDQVETAIKRALEYKRWTVKEQLDNKIIAEIYVRTHYAKVEISYDTESYSIKYLDSSNLKRNETHNKIHRNYNKWIKLLEQEIQGYISRT